MNVFFAHRFIKKIDKSNESEDDMGMGNFVFPREYMSDHQFHRNISKNDDK